MSDLYQTKEECACLEHPHIEIPKGATLIAVMVSAVGKGAFLFHGRAVVLNMATVELVQESSFS